MAENNKGPTNASNYDLADSFDPRVIPTNAPKGTLFRYVPDSGAVTILIKEDYGKTTNWSLLTAGGASPTGPAGGDLAGTYPNPTIPGFFVPDVTRYVDPVEGDDTLGTGAFNKPYQTIAKAISDLTGGGTVVLAVGTYSEAQVVIPTNISLVGQNSSTTVISNGVSFTPGAGFCFMSITNISVNGTNGVEVDASAASSGNVVLNNGAFKINRLDTNMAVQLSVQGAITASSTFRGTNFATFLSIYANVDVVDGGLLSLQSGLILGGMITISDSSTLRTTNTYNYSAGTYVTGVPVGPDTPTWETDEVSNFVYAGTLNKIILQTSVIPSDQTMYVSDSTGSDTEGNGSVSMPFKTIQKASDVLALVGGGSIILEDGVYGEPTPNLFNIISIVGTSPLTTSISNGLNFVAVVGNNGLNLSNILVSGTISLDMTLASAAYVNLFNVNGTLVQSDANPVVNYNVLNGVIQASTFCGQGLFKTVFVGANVFKTGSAMSLQSGIEFGATLELQGTCQLITLACINATGGSYVLGTPIGPDTPTWTTDAASDAAYTGTLVKTVYGGVNVSDEGTPLGFASSMNFVGSLVTVTYLSGVATVTISDPTGFANRALSNLTSPTAINQDLIFNKSGPIIQTKNDVGTTESLSVLSGDSSGADSGAITIKTGLATTTGGLIEIATSDLAGTATTGLISIESGAKSGTSGDTGSVSIVSGNNTVSASGWATGGIFINSGLSNSPAGASGPVSIGSGDAANTATSGDLNLRTGQKSGTTGASGNVTIHSGSNLGTGVSGTVSLTSGTTGAGASSGLVAINSGNSTTAASGAISVVSGTTTTATSGAVTVASGAPSGAGASGVVTVQSGNTSTVSSGGVTVSTGTTTSATSGDVTINSGNSTAGNSGGIGMFSGDATTGTANSGGVTISTGIAGANSGPVLLSTGGVNVSGTTGSISIDTGDNAGTGDSGTAEIRTGETAAGNSGTINITSGQSDTMVSGTIFVVSGDAGTISGDVVILTGTAAGDSGGLDFETGQSTGGNSGNMDFQTGSSVIATTGEGRFHTGDGVTGSGAINIFSGAASTGQSGQVNLTTGDAPASLSGDISIFTGTGNQGTGNQSSGSISIESGIVTDGNSGDINLITGNSTNDISGNVNLYTGDSANSGNITISSGVSTNGITGAVNIFSNISSGGDSGTLTFYTGDNNDVASAFNTGSLSLATGNLNDAGSTGFTGDITVSTGANSGAAPSGSIYLNTGSSNGGDRGRVQVDALIFGLPVAAADPTGTFTGGELYYNSVSGLVRYYNGVLATWSNL